MGLRREWRGSGEGWAHCRVISVSVCHFCSVQFGVLWCPKPNRAGKISRTRQNRTGFGTSLEVLPQQVSRGEAGADGHATSCASRRSPPDAFDQTTEVLPCLPGRFDNEFLVTRCPHASGTDRAAHPVAPLLQVRMLRRHPLRQQVPTKYASC